MFPKASLRIGVSARPPAPKVPKAAKVPAIAKAGKAPGAAMAALSRPHVRKSLP